MENPTQNRNNVFALVCSIWFALTGWIWTYFICLFIALPAGIAGVYFVYKSHTGGSLNRTGLGALLILLIGVIISVVAGLMYR